MRECYYLQKYFQNATPFQNDWKAVDLRDILRVSHKTHWEKKILMKFKINEKNDRYFTEISVLK